MGKKPGMSDDDRALFRQSVADVRPLKQRRCHPTSPRVGAWVRPERYHGEEGALFDDPFSDAYAAEPVGVDESLLFYRDGLQHTILRKLRRGQLPVRAELDLHGLRVEEARATLGDFLQRTQDQSQRCVRIIHGKGHRSAEGKPVLKTQLNYWLRQSREVLAFCSATPADGGTGALYLLLRGKKFDR